MPTRSSVATFVSASVVACSMLAGCTSGDDPEPRPTPTAPTSTTSAHVNLRFGVYGDEATVATYRTIADAYTSEHPEVTFTITANDDAGSAADVAAATIESGDDPPDVFLLDRDYLPAIVQADVLQPVNSLLEERGIPFGDGFQRVALNSFAANNELACMPNDVSPLVMFFNRRLLKPRQLVSEDGTPVVSIAEGWRWEVFLAAVQQVASQGVTGVYLPPDLEYLSPIIMSGGGQIVDDQRQPTSLDLSDEDTEAVLKTIATITRDRSLSLSPVEAERTPPLERFEEGRLGIMIGTRALVPHLRKVKGLRFDVAPMPRIDKFHTVSEMNGYCIAKNSEHVDAAADFIAYAVDGDGAKIAAASGGIVPSSLDVLHSEEFEEPGQLPHNVGVFGEGVRRSDEQPYSTAWGNATALAHDVLARVLFVTSLDVTSEQTPELDALLEQADEESKAIFSPPKPTQTPTP